MTETPSWQQLLELVEQLNGSDYESASVQFGDVSVQLSKTAPLAGPNISAPANANPSATPAAATPAVATTSAPAAPPAPAATTGDTVTAPMIGVFYRRPAPGTEPFVQAGDRVEADTTIGIIEIMKLMNPVTAGKAGVLGEFLVADAEAVEFGQPLVSITVS